MRPLVTTAMKNATLGQTKKTTASFAPAVVPRRRRCHGEKVSKGYTLLELILALSLSIVVLTLIFGAINLYVLQLTKHQARVERELVSRAVLKIMANDIRAALESRPIQYSGINDFLESATLANNVASGELRLEDADTAAAKKTAAEKTKAQQKRGNLFRPRFSGTAGTITFDLRRPAEISQLNPASSSQDWEQRSTGSNITSVSYFYSSPSGDATSGAPVSGGMYRREVPRRPSQPLEQTDSPENLTESSELLAGEVAKLGFRYFDGRDWFEVWDSTSSHKFPAAVEISVIVAPHTANASYPQRTGQGPAQELYQLIVYRPSTEPAQEQQ